MSDLLTQCGSKRVSLEELLMVQDPEKTNTYTPLNHYDFAVNVKTVASDLLREFTFSKDAYALSSDNGNKMFGVLSYTSKSTSDNDPLRLSIGIRNSHCKSYSCGVVIGASVIVCDNLMFKGDLSILRKHTGNMHQDLMDQLVTTIYKSQHQYTQLSFDAAAMMNVSLDLHGCYKYLGILTGEGVLSPTQSTKAYKELDKPSHPEFEKRTLWSAYNHATEALKSSPPQSMVRKHTKLHALTEELYLN